MIPSNGNGRQRVVGTKIMDFDAGVSRGLLDGLNPQQHEGVCLQWGPALIIAGAGSGKTTVLTRRIAYLITQLNQDPESVLAVTFTNKAAQEMKGRVEALVGFDTARRLSIGTFHSICARLLRQEIEQFRSEEGLSYKRNFVIYDETDSVNVLKGQISKLNLDEKVFAAKDVRYAISAAKNDGLTAARYGKGAKTYRETRLAEIYAQYQAELVRNNALDFDDLILIFNDLLESNEAVRRRQTERFRHILVDEFQDTNKSQYDLIRAISGMGARKAQGMGNDWQERSLMVVGDVDQSIYSWRKADFRIILGFQKDFQEAKLIKLEENYRSTSTILEVANSIITNNSERIEKVLRCNRSKGSKAQFYEATDEIDEAYYVVEELKRLSARGKQLSDCVILYRTNAQSRAIEEILVRNHLPYTVVGATRFYERQEIKDVLAYLRLIYNEADSQAFYRVVNVPKRGLGKTTIERLTAFAEMTHKTLVEAALNSREIEDISEKTAARLVEFASLIRRWHDRLKDTEVTKLLDGILKETRYLEKLEEDAGSFKDEQALSRIENVRELMVVAKEFEAVADSPDLDSFLTRISLVSDLDTLDINQDAVKMMTLHSAKGLEFPVVFLIGLEEGLFPHIRSLDSPTALEEERRLMYVGVTRAADLLYMTLARKRIFLGRSPGGSSSFSSSYTIPSRFLKEITPGLLSGYYPQPQANKGSIDSDSSGISATSSGATALRAGVIRRIPEMDVDSHNQRGAKRWSPDSIQMSGTAGGAKSEEAFEHLKVGDLVQHAKFGIGQVTLVIGENEKELYNVEFKTAGKRLLDPRFAKLIKLS
ncbi:MAG: AAA family ATPase [Candidatus Melainabacteria bacterium]|nr:MAG: AAA family ATPase [Candidatus Melainabacteria bacterium]